MNAKRLNEIIEQTKSEKEFANDIMNGVDNYLGTDGAKTVQQLCGYIEELIAAITPTP